MILEKKIHNYDVSDRLLTENPDYSDLAANVTKHALLLDLSKIENIIA